MKKILFIICLFISGSCFSQKIYSVGYLGYSHSVYNTFNYNVGKEQRMTTEYLYFSLDGGYKYKSMLFESGISFDGNWYMNLLAGKRFPLAKKISADILAGAADNVNVLPRIHLVQKVYPQVVGRINLGALSIQSVYVNKTFEIGIGVNGFIDKKMAL